MRYWTALRGGLGALFCTQIVHKPLQERSGLVRVQRVISGHALHRFFVPLVIYHDLLHIIQVRLNPTDLTPHFPVERRIYEPVQQLNALVKAFLGRAVFHEVRVRLWTDIHISFASQVGLMSDVVPDRLWEILDRSGELFLLNSKRRRIYSAGEVGQIIQ